jgi:hypothetical protein
MFGKDSKIPWQTKCKLHQKSNKPALQGSIDQLESPTPGIIAQIKGVPTTQICKCKTSMEALFSRFTFVYPSETIMFDESLKAKLSFEQLAKQMGPRSNNIRLTMVDLPINYSNKAYTTKS